MINEKAVHRSTQKLPPKHSDVVRKVLKEVLKAETIKRSS